nr:chemosensory protein [Lasioderma serricorne]
MKSLSLLIAIFAVFVAVSASPEDTTYPTKYDNIDIDMILQNKRLFNNYVKCLLDQGRCNEEGQTLKNVIPEALTTNCAKCNDKQRETVKKVIKFLIEKRKSDWDALIAKYDPDGTYYKNYKHYLNE